MEVDGGPLDLPLLIERTITTSNSSDGGNTTTEFSMIVSQLQVTFFVLDCGHDIGLLVGSYDNYEEASVAVEQVCMCVCEDGCVPAHEEWG